MENNYTNVKVVNLDLSGLVICQEEISLRKLAKKLKKFFNIKISHEGIRKWLLISENTISPREIVVLSTWHVDETYIKIKGSGFWLWIVYCSMLLQ